jgi:hypothetical protein
MQWSPVEGASSGEIIAYSLISIFSIAGLLAARVLSDHFEEVTVIEPDAVLDGRRTRVPQWNQLHGISTNFNFGRPADNRL